LPRIEGNVEDQALFAVNKQDEKNKTKSLQVTSAIDKGVYVVERLFRTYGGEKQGKNNPLLPWQTRLSTKLDPRIFSLALVAVVACHPDDVAIVRAHPELQHVLCTDNVWQVAEAETPKRGIKRLKQAESSSKATAPTTSATTASVMRSSFPKAEQHLDNLFVKCPLISKQARCTGKIEADEKGTPWAQIMFPSKDNPHAIKCPNKGAAHKSNCIYCHVNMKTGDGFFSCSDGECVAALQKSNKKNVFGGMSFLEFF